MIRVIVQVGEERFNGSSLIDTGYRVFEIDNPAFEILLKENGPSGVRLLGVEVFEKPPAPLALVPAPTPAPVLPLAAPVGPVVAASRPQAEVLAELRAKHRSNGIGSWPWWLGGKRKVKSLPLP